MYTRFLMKLGTEHRRETSAQTPYRSCRTTGVLNLHRTRHAVDYYRYTERNIYDMGGIMHLHIIQTDSILPSVPASSVAVAVAKVTKSSINAI